MKPLNQHCPLNSGIRPGMIRLGIGILIVFAPALGISSEHEGVSSPKGHLTLQPERVEASLFYSGQTVRITDHVPAGSQVAMICSDLPRTIHLKRQGKVGGILWMSTGEVTFTNVPSFYQLSTSAPLKVLIPQVTRPIPVPIGYQGMPLPQVESASPVDERVVFNDFINLKKREGVYAIHEGGVHKVKEPSGLERVDGECHFPSRALMGKYTVRMFIFRGGLLESVRERSLHLEQVRTARFISSLAMEHGLIYGFFAVLVAILIGFLTGVVFGIKSKKVH